jgi:hypothetical protein
MGSALRQYRSPRIGPAERTAFRRSYGNSDGYRPERLACRQGISPFHHQTELAGWPGVLGRGRCRLGRGRGRRGERRRGRCCGGRRCRGHRRRCCGAGCCRHRRVLLGNWLLRRLHRLQGDVNRIGCEPRGSTVGFRTDGHGLRLIAAECKRYGELAAGLDRELARRATALAQRGFRFRSRRFGCNGQRLGLRSGFEKIQARHRCRARGQHQATGHDGNHSAHDPTPTATAAAPPERDYRGTPDPHDPGALLSPLWLAR